MEAESAAKSSANPTFVLIRFQLSFGAYSGVVMHSPSGKLAGELGIALMSWGVLEHSG